MSKNKLINQLPAIGAILIFLILCGLYLSEIKILNALPFTTEKIIEEIKPFDILIGLTIYLKTSIDFALLIGTLMSKYKGVKNRFAIEIGTALGNALGTFTILGVWVFFKEVKWLLAIMVIFASLVLFEMAKTSIEHLEETDHDQKDQVSVKPWQKQFANLINSFLNPILKVIGPVVSKVLPNLSFQEGDDNKTKSFWGLILTSFTIPFILGLDDFAGYVPLFNTVNVFGFGVGVFLGHCILNLFLFLNPDATTRIIKNPIIALLGSLAFIILACYGLYEGGHLLLGVFGLFGKH